jgi:hypothetical protein
MQAVQLRRITRERDRADRIAQFMTDIFKVADPEQKLGNTVTARDVLESRTRYRHGSGPRLRTPGAPDVRDGYGLQQSGPLCASASAFGTRCSDLEFCHRSRKHSNSTKPAKVGLDAVPFQQGQ